MSAFHHHAADAPVHQMLAQIMGDRANNGMHPMDMRTKTAIIDALIDLDGADVISDPAYPDDSYAGNIRPQQLDDAHFQRIAHILQDTPQIARAWALARTQPIHFAFTSFTPDSAHYIVGVDA